MELGCGLGMLGLAVCGQCRARSYTFTDNSAHVLRLTSNNIQINMAQARRRARKASGPKVVGLGEEAVQYDHGGDKGRVLTSGGASGRLESPDNVVSEIGETAGGNGDGLRGIEDDPSSGGNRDSEVMKMSVCSISDLQNSDDSVLNLDEQYWQECGPDLFSFVGDKSVRVGRLDWEKAEDQLNTVFDETDIILAAG